MTFPAALSQFIWTQERVNLADQIISYAFPQFRIQKTGTDPKWVCPLRWQFSSSSIRNIPPFAFANRHSIKARTTISKLITASRYSKWECCLKSSLMSACGKNVALAEIVTDLRLEFA